MDGWLDTSFGALSVKMQQEIKKEIKQVKQHLFAAKTEPLVEHISSCSVPVFNIKNELVGAITAVGFKNLIPADYLHPTAQKMIALSQCLANYFK